MSLTRSCDLDGGTTDVLRYTLVRTAKIGEEPTTRRSWGGMDLCKPCWEAVARPHSRHYGNPHWQQEGSRLCSRCHRSKASTKRYGLKKSIRDNGKVIDLPSGGIDLCDPCWRETGATNLRGRERERRLRAMEYEERAKFTLLTGGDRA